MMKNQMESLPYKVLRYLFIYVTNIFFKEIQIVGIENIPRKGPVLLFGNHNNQFVDALVQNENYVQLLVSTCSRQVRFIGAAWVIVLINQYYQSMRQPIIGQVMRALGVIPVERPSDIAIRGTGTIQIIQNGKYLIGSNTKFTQEVSKGETLLIKGVSKIFKKIIQIQDVLVVNVISDTQLEFKSDEKFNNDKLEINQQFQIQPKVDQHELFDYVWKELQNNSLIGIFPEGGSHDRTELLPLKAGICIMALGAMQKYQLDNIYLQPVGLNYYKRDKFRSKVIVEYGVPKRINKEMLELYQTNKREAISILLKDIEMYLNDVTVFQQSYGGLQATYLTRQMYKPNDKHLTNKQGLELDRRFSKGLKVNSSDPDVRDAKYRIRLYQKKLKSIGITDDDVLKLTKKPLNDMIDLTYSLVMTIFYLIFALPGVIMNGPIALLLSYMSERKRVKELADTRIKIECRDIVASQKVISAIVIIPISIVVYTFIFYLLINDSPYGQDGKAMKYSILFLLLWPIYITILISANDELMRHARIVKSKIFFFLHGNSYLKLKKTRENIQSLIRDIVKKLGSQTFPEFEKLRIVKEEDFLNKSIDLIDNQNDKV